MFDPEESENEGEEKKIFDRGTVLRIKTVSIEFILRKKEKVTTKGYMVTDEDHRKILNELVDPGFSSIPIKK